MNHYTKTNEKGRTYDVFKLRLDDGGVEVYTTLWHQTSIPLKSRVKVKLKVDKVTFYDYLKGFYAPSTALYEIYEDNPPLDVKPLYRWIDNQHENEKIAELYKTLLFATPISKELRDEVQKWGISHLIAISGYNVGVISFLLFFFLKPLYQFFQSRYFPYRNAAADKWDIAMNAMDRVNNYKLTEYLKEGTTEAPNKPHYRDWETDRKSTRLNSSHITRSRMPSSA